MNIPDKIEFSEHEGGAKIMIRDDISFLAPGEIVVFISFQKLKRVWTLGSAVIYWREWVQDSRPQAICGELDLKAENEKSIWGKIFK